MLRMYVNRQELFGTTDWQATAAAMLGLPSTLRKRGGSEACLKSSLSSFLIACARAHDSQRRWTSLIRTSTSDAMNSDLLIRMSAFLGALTLMALWEVGAPRRSFSMPRGPRWFANITVVILDAVIVRLLFAAGAVGMAILAAERNWGILNQLSWPIWPNILLTVIALDFVLYLQHVMFHAIPLFWRFHMMHHADLDCDVTTGVRFHPVEVVLSMVIKLGAVVLLGAAPVGVLVFEIMLNATSMFNHSNIWMPVVVDRALRWMIVTPDMHRIHHSVLPQETNSNFGFNLPWWDRLLGTYREDPLRSHTIMSLGLEQYRDPRELTLRRILALPFVGAPGRYPLARRE
jgi:sterol desaturase/sphingolipid hydroxylase (fatty acid hydroxylase superfamily)